MANPTFLWSLPLNAINGGGPITVGSDGSIYLTGTAGGSLDGQPYNGGVVDVFVTKFSLNGGKVWTRLLGGSDMDWPTAITSTPDGSIYVSGFTASSFDEQVNRGSTDAFLTKYSADGAKVWTRLLGSAYGDSATSITAGQDGSIYIGGWTNASLTDQAYGGGSIFVAKYALNGTNDWIRQAGSNSGVDSAQAMVTGLDGSIYVSGNAYGSLDGQPYSGGSDVFLIKYNADGTKVWSRQMGASGDDRAIALTTALDGSIYLSGTTDGSLDGQTNSGGKDAFLTKYSADGTKVWTRLLGTAEADQATDLSAGLDGAIYLSGNTDGSLDGQINSGYTDGYVAKYTAAGSKVWTLLLGTKYPDETVGITTGLDGSFYISGSLPNTVSSYSLVKYQDLSAAATFTLGATNYTVNEGSTATFTLTATNLPAGTSVGYGLSGSRIAWTDFANGQLSGTVTLDSQGKATIAVPIAADQQTEGAETLVVSTLWASVSLAINDTSLTPTYGLIAGSSSVNEGSTAIFNLTTSNVPVGTTVAYTLSGGGITSGDITGGLLSGSTVVDASGKATILIPITADQTTEGPETLVITAQGITASVQVNDLSINLGLSISGTDKADSLAGSQGSDTIFGAAGVDTVFYSSNQNTYGIVNGVGGLLTVSSLKDGIDSLYNVERLRFADMSLALDVGASQTAGQSVLLLGTVLPGKLALDSSKQPLMGAVISLFDSGYSMVDLAGALLRLDIWTILTGQSISATSRTLAEDTVIVKYLLSNVYGLTPDDVTLKANADVMHNEKSQGGWLAGLAGASAGQNHIGLQALAQKGLAYIAPESLSYGVSQVGGMGNDVLEGANLVFTLKTNLASGTLVPYALTGAGITTQDFSWAQSLSGNMTVGPYGEASMWVYTAMDKLTEGPETLVFTARGLSSSVMIQDTSQGPEQTIVLTPPSTAVNEGTFATFTLNTTNVTTGTIYAYSLSGTGISGSDFGGGQLSGSIAINAAGAATISIPIAADFVTEGPETLILTVAGKTASVVINDTAVAPVSTYRLSAVGSSVNEGSTAIFNLATTYLPVGTSVPYAISGEGIDSGDIYGGQLSGTVVIAQNGTAVISVPTLADVSTERAETLIVTVAGNSAQIVINDTSRGTPSYQLFPSALAVNVGDTLVVTLKTTNLDPGTVVPYILKGVPSTDIVGGILSGAVVVDTSGTANINIAIAQHQTTDILTVNVADQNIQVTLVGVKGG